LSLTARAGIGDPCGSCSSFRRIRCAARVSRCGGNVSVVLNRSIPVITPLFVIGCMR